MKALILPFTLLALLCGHTMAAKTSASSPDARPWLPHPDQPLAYALEEQAYLEKAVQNYGMEYDEEKKLLLGGGGPGKQRQHVIRWSLEYAVVLMNTGNALYQKRAFDIIDVVLSHQAIAPGKKHHGNWPKALEEPIQEGRRADGNQADFIAMALLDIVMAHGDRLPPELKARIDEALVLAARYISSRSLRPTYTNAYMMGVLNLLAISERCSLPDIKTEGMVQLDRIHELSMDQGSYTEYQSPNYTTLVLDVLYRLLAWTRDPAVREKASKLYHFTWEHIASQYHPPSRQWAGPQSRNRGGEEILESGYAEMIDAAVYDTPLGRIDPPDRRAARNLQLRHRVPEDLRPRFTGLPEPRESVQVFWSPTEIARKYSTPDDISTSYDSDVIGTTYLSPKLALGTVNRGFFGPDRRGMMAHWGTAKAPAYMYLQCLKNNLPFCAVQHFAVQEKNRALVAINFSTNGGDTHWFFDRIKGRFDAKDLRLRFEFGGAVAKTGITLPNSADGEVIVRTGDVTFRIKAPVAVFDSAQVSWQKGRSADKAWADLVLHKGANKTFDLARIGEAVIGMALASDSGSQTTSFEALTAQIVGQRLAMAWGGLDLSVPAIPDRDKVLQATYEASVRGESRKHLERKNP